MGWYVVKFENENKAVSNIWYSKDTRECSWPPSDWSRNKIAYCIKFKNKPEHD